MATAEVDAWQPGALTLGAVSCTTADRKVTSLLVGYGKPQIRDGQFEKLNDFTKQIGYLEFAEWGFRGISHLCGALDSVVTMPTDRRPSLPDPKSTRSALLSAAQSLCSDFASGSSTDVLLKHFSPNATAHEHGNPSHAPFLGTTFTSTEGIEQYFNLLQELLSFTDMAFSDYMVDDVGKVVCVKGSARFTWTTTQKGWNEVYIYRLGFVEGEDGEGRSNAWKVCRYEVWADSGSL
jgi:hypothetical protein